MSRPSNGCSTIRENEDRSDAIVRALFADLKEHVHDHRPLGSLAADATEPAWNGYLLTLACSCGVVFERWVTPEEADADLLRLAALT